LEKGDTQNLSESKAAYLKGMFFEPSGEEGKSEARPLGV
jgi:hypothetical protein